MTLNLKRCIIAISLMTTSCLGNCYSCLSCDPSDYKINNQADASVEHHMDVGLDAGQLDASVNLYDSSIHDAGVHDIGSHDASIHDVGEHDVGVHDTGIDANIPCGEFCAMSCGNDNNCINECLSSLCSGG